MRPLVLILALALLPAPAPGQTAPGLTPAVRLAWWTDAGFLTPFAVSILGPAGVTRLTLIYDTLVWKDGRGVIPWLAASWRASPDGTAYVFTLRSDVRWHDGRPLTARDVRFSFEYYRRHPFRWIDTSMVGAVEVRDRRTVVIRLARRYAPFIENVAGTVPIIPAHVWQAIEHPEQAQTLAAAVGSGPYRLVEYRPESGQYRLVAFDDYFRGRPQVREIQYVVIPQERQMLAVQSGQVDAGVTTTRDALALFTGHPYLRVLETEPLSIARLVFNLDHPVAGQRGFRQAVAYALDRQRIADTATRGPGIAGNPGVVPPTSAWFNPRARRYPYDPAAARGLLRELGYIDRDGDGWLEQRDGTRLVVGLVAGPTADAEVIRQMLKVVGIEVRVRTVDPATRAQLAAEGRFEMLYTTHIGSGGDPDYLRTWFTGAAANEFASGSVMRSPEFVRLAALQLAELDPARRRAHVDRMQALLSDEMPTLALYYRRFFWVYDGRKFAPFATQGGLLNGIPLLDNKLAFLPGGR